MSECRLRDRSSLTVYPGNAGAVTINVGSGVRSLLFLQDGRHLLSGSDDCRIRQWRINDGVEVGEAMNTTGGHITGMALSPDGNWIVCSGKRVASVWNMRTRQRTLTISEHSNWVNPVDVSPDSSRFVTGSDDSTAVIWDIATGTRLVGPLQHNSAVLGVKFSPSGDRIATGDQETLRIYHAVSGELLRTFQVSITSFPSTPIWWSSTQSIFAISSNTLFHLDENTGRTFYSWTIPGVVPVNNCRSISLASNNRFIGAYVGNSISLWDPSTSAQICSVITNSSDVWSFAISSDSKYLISSVKEVITIRNLDSIIPAYYLAGEQPLGGEADLQLQFQALRDEFHALQSRFGMFLGKQLAFD